MIKISDNNYIIAGITTSFGIGQNEGWLIKIDSNGNEIWNRTFGGSQHDILFSIESTNDNGFIACGFNESQVGYQNAWLIKIDSNGNEEWNKTYGGSEWDSSSSVIQTNDRGYILAGKTNSFGFKKIMTWILKTDSEGVEEWNKTYGGKNSDSANYILQTYDGGYLILGRTESFGSGKRDIWLLKINSNGNEEWNMTFGGEKDDEGYSILNTLDYGYIIAGSTYSDDLETSDAWLIKLKPDNLPPTPAFSITPSSGDFSTTFTFDASSSTDDKDNPSDLHVRWDFDNDGIYDTEFSNVKTATHKYSKGGLKTIKLEIKDSENFANHLIKSFYVNIPPNATIINISQSIALKGQEISFRGAGTDEGKVLKSGSSEFLSNDAEAKEFYLGERFSI